MALHFCNARPCPLCGHWPYQPYIQPYYPYYPYIPPQPYVPVPVPVPIYPQYPLPLVQQPHWYAIEQLSQPTPK